MAGPYPLATLAPTIDANGISAPPYSDILASLQASYRLIYGADVYLEPDSQDGQWLAITASAQNDTNAAIIATYNAFSPATAQGVGLSSVVRINGLERLVATNSTADLTIIGEAGTVITNGMASDVFGNQWALPVSVTIDITGDVVSTAVCLTQGAIAAQAGTITAIVTPTRGWQSVNNVAAATLGAPVEDDATLRQRQRDSTALSSITPMAAINAAVANISGVQRYRGYENDTSVTDGDGIPSHSISMIVEGGDALEIATAIALKKSPGTGTYGTTTEVVYDEAGVPNTIRFYRPTLRRVVVAITANALPGYVSTTGDAIKNSASAYVSGLPIGGDVYYTKVIGAADLQGQTIGTTFNITALTMAFHGDAPGVADLVVAFNEAAYLDVVDITLTVT